MAAFLRKISVLAAVWLGAMTALPAWAQITPVLDAIEPNVVVPQRLPVELTGDGFLQEGFATTISFNGTTVPAEDVLAISAVRILVLVPAGATSGPVRVHVGAAMSNGWEVAVTEGDYVPDEVIAVPHVGAHGGRLLALSALRLLEVVPIAETVYYHLAIDDGRGIPQAIRDLFATGLVTTASANFIYSAQALPSKQTASPPNDPYFAPKPPTDPAFDPAEYGLQYGPQRIRAIDGRKDTPDAQRLAAGKEKIIAVIDTGIDAAHEDLQGKVIGFKDFVNNKLEAYDDDGHGTHVAGIAAAHKNNAKGIVGIAPEAKLYGVKVLSPTGGIETDLMKGVWHAVRIGAQVINLSLESKAPFIDRKFLDDALAQNRVLVIAAGNSGDGDPEKLDPKRYPAAYSHDQNPDGIIAVANSRANDEIFTKDPLSKGSTNEKYVDVAAPGHKIWSTFPGNQYKEMTGTSMAAPHVSGVVALMLEVDPRLSPTQIECLLEITAVDRGVPGKDIAFGHGRVDAYAAVHAVQSLGERYHLLPPECNSLKPLPPGPVPPGPVPPIQPPPVADIAINKFSNGVWSPVPPGPFIPVGGAVRWTYLVRNTGGLPLAGIAVVDARIGAVACPAGILPPGGFMFCAANGFALPGQYKNVATVTALDPAGAVVGNFDIGHYFGFRTIPGTNKPSGQGQHNQVLTITADSQTALVGTIPKKTVKIDLQTQDATEFGESPARPASDVVLTPDQTQALVLEFPGEDQAVFGQLRRINLATDEEETLSMRPPVTEIAVTPDGGKALVGTSWGLEIIDLVAMTSVQLQEFRALTGIAITADGSKALVGVPQGVAVINLASATHTLLPVGPVLSGLALSADGAMAVAGVAGGIVLIDLATNTTTRLSSGTPVSNILVTPDNQKAIFAALFGAVVVDLRAKSFVQVPTPASPVTDIELTSDGRQALFATVSGITVVQLADNSQTIIALPAPVVSGLSLSPDNLLAAVGVSSGIAIVDLEFLDFELIETSGMPVTNVAITPDSMTGLVGIPAGIVVIDLPSATAEMLDTSYPLVTPTIAPDGSKAIFGTLSGISIIDIGENTVDQVYDSPPILNLLPNNGQPPLNPDGERGAPGPSDG